MLTIVRSKVDPETLKKIAEDLKGYVKVVVDVRRKILAAASISNAFRSNRDTVPGSR